MIEKCIHPIERLTAEREFNKADGSFIGTRLICLECGFNELMKGIVEINKPVKVYVVEARRWGIRENHSYVVSCYYDKDKAIESAKAEHEAQGNKYKVVVNECDLNKHDPSTVKEVFTTQIE